DLWSRRTRAQGCEASAPIAYLLSAKPLHLRELYTPSSRLPRDRSDEVARRCRCTRHPQLYLRMSHTDTSRDRYQGMFLVLLQRECFCPAPWRDGDTPRCCQRMDTVFRLPPDSFH